MKTTKPTQCHLWKKDELTLDDLDFEKVEKIIESSHLDRRIVRCKRCGQLYFYEFYEVVNFDGNDDIHTTYIPIKQYDTEELKTKSPLEMLAYSPRLQWDTKNNDKIAWVGK